MTPVQQLVHALVASGDAATRAELEVIRTAVARAGYHAGSLTKGGVRAAGTLWQGRLLTGSERLPVGDIHYIRHVLKAQEWPLTTTYSTYVASLRDAILAPDGPVVLDVVAGTPRLTFFAPSGRSRGPGGGNWILVAYGVDYGYWTSGYQPRLEPEEHRQHFIGGASRWLLSP